MNEQNIREVYDGMVGIEAPDMPDYATFRDNVVLFFPTDKGGIAFTKENGCLWVHVYCPECLPSMKSMKNMLLLASCTSRKCVKACTVNPKMASLLKRLNFRRESAQTWSRYFQS